MLNAAMLSRIAPVEIMRERGACRVDLQYLMITSSHLIRSSLIHAAKALESIAQRRSSRRAADFTLRSCIQILRVLRPGFETYAANIMRSIVRVLCGLCALSVLYNDTVIVDRSICD